MREQWRREEEERAAAASAREACAATPSSELEAWRRHARDFDEFLSASMEPVRSASAIPWPPEPGRLLEATADALASAEDGTQRPYRAAFRLLQLRWHEDKFFSRLAGRLDDTSPQELEAIRQHVRALNQALNEQWSQRSN